MSSAHAGEMPLPAAGRRYLLVFLVYVICGWAGIEYASAGGGSLSMIWLPSGISLGACLVFGRGIWPAIWLGSFVANTPYLIASPASGSLIKPLLIGILAASINTVFQALMAHARYLRYVDGRGFYSEQNIIRFMSRVIVPPALCNIGLLVILYTAGGYWEPAHPNLLLGMARIALVCLLADLHGYFVIVPMVACFQAAGRRRLGDYIAEGHVFVALAGFVALALAGFYLTPMAVYLFIPLGVFVALKIGVRAAAVFVFATSMTLTFATAQGVGPFAYDNFGSAYTALLLFVFSLGLPVLLLAAETRALRDAYNTLEDRVRERTRRLDEANRKLEQLSRTDLVTGLANRRHLDEHLQTEWQRALRNGTPIRVILIDVDHFKEYNDHYGHPAGDAVLSRVATALRRSLKRPGDFVARYGGEEFLLVLPETGQAKTVAERCRQAVEDLDIPHEYSATAGVVTVSAGYAAAMPTPDGRVEDLVKSADSAMYEAKHAGRNRVAGDDCAE